MSIVILTGAGISAESGLGTFRDEDGLWTKYDLNEVATPEGFARNPALVQDFYNARRANCRGASPNAAHHALGRLVAARPDTVVVTQNVDDLHERGGVTDVIHMHGELFRALCAACDHRWDAPEEMSVSAPCPACGAPATRPDVVWFGEMPYHMERIFDALERATLFVAIGTSGSVYPAAGFVGEARANRVETLELNLEPSDVGGQFDAGRYGPASEIVPLWVDEVLGAR
ncbi:NAD-dependent deacylase [Maritimibacter sp. UBA3975]|uniref:NAD-dependent deacylase n=1 Tax=Maritimibacter sp. UBA3975 TaxID=1946833 RepID=UPI000C090DA4|nr:NAD-dependent deacylase [Maritimibacter sp. UBA3975]MAM62800.1 NAD-dependent protein deacylase [Maritimibacter sp.]|tara:strand:- start:9774 stop:10463 length:690 start_codon:yes stop_codon:yes gene_type:complete